MSEKKTLLRNNSLVFANRILSKIITFFLMLFLARVLEPAKFGELSLLITMASIFTTLQDLGTSPIIVRQIASRKFDPVKTLAAILLTKIITASFFILSFLLLIDLLDYSSFAGNLAYLFAIGFVAESLLLSFVKYFEGKEEMRLSSILIIAERMIIATAIIFFSFSISLFKSYGISYLISNGLVIIVASYFFIRKYGFIKNIEFGIVKELLILSFPFIIYNIFSIIYFRLDIFIISNYFQEALVGTYRASYQLVDSLYFISLSLSVSLLPFFSRKFREDNEFLKKSFSFINKELIYFGILLAILLFFNSEHILNILYKDKYLHGAATLGILSLTLPLFFGNNVMGNLLIGIGKEKIQISSMVISTFIKTILLIFLVRSDGIMGAGISCLIAEFISFCIQYYGVRINGYRLGINKSDLIIILLIVFAILVGIFLKNLFLHAIVIMLIFSYHSKDNFKLLINTIRNKET